ncbi:nucleoside kinase [Miniphocaeibacter massiliensis]|uniref:nucleoside kinase n=1 Tax=Miniphocaeibacter massiliensis TaxID=2041841 RepID=UPI001F5DD294|nr:nucleoside kinase [Miniphocaeibacter massiliensis]
MKVYLGNKKIEIQEGMTYLELSEKIFKDKEKIGVIVENSLKNLQDKVKEGDRLFYFGKYSTEGHVLMQRTIILVFIMACKSLYPDKTVQVEHSIGESMYCELKGKNKLLHTDVELIKKEMQKIINSDYKVYRKKTDIETALNLFAKEGYDDKVLLFKNMDLKEVSYYEVNNNIFTFHGYLAPSTGFIDNFDIISYYPGVAITIPSSNNGKIPEFKEEKTLAKVFSNSKKWTDLLNVENVGNLNEYIIDKDIKYIVDISEAYFENQISEIAENIISDSDINLVQIAGPSSSGKTTTAYRLSVQLGSRGKRPILISTDDYFVNREDTPLNENGERDYEVIEAIDLPKFNDDLMSLMEGKEIELPRFNFLEGKREKSGKKIKLNGESIIIIEGLHCLNPKLTSLVPDKNKFKIYISALTQLNIDNHNRIASTDVRFLRRMIRDDNFRGNSVEDTFEIWEKVRRGEELYIFPYQDLADVAVDSSLIYELSVLKKHAYKLLNAYDKNGEFYKEVKKLKSFLKYFLDIEDESIIPVNSILREIIG